MIMMLMMLMAQHELQSLAGEKRRVQSAAAQLERELVAREGQLAGQAGELAALQEAHRDANAQMNQYVLDLQVGKKAAYILTGVTPFPGPETMAQTFLVPFLLACQYSSQEFAMACRSGAYLHTKTFMVNFGS